MPVPVIVLAVFVTLVLIAGALSAFTRWRHNKTKAKGMLLAFAPKGRKNGR